MGDGGRSSLWIECRLCRFFSIYPLKSCFELIFFILNILLGSNMSQFVQLKCVGAFSVLSDSILEMMDGDATVGDDAFEPIDLIDDLLGDLDNQPMCELPLRLSCLPSLASDVSSSSCVQAYYKVKSVLTMR